MHGKGDQRLFFLLDGCQCRRGFTTLNKQLFKWLIISWIDSLLIFNMFYTKNSFIQKYWLEFTTEKTSCFIGEITDFFATGGIQLTALLGPVPNGTLNPRGLPLSPHFRDVMPLWLSGRRLLWSSHQCRLRAHNGRTQAPFWMLKWGMGHPTLQLPNKRISPSK